MLEDVPMTDDQEKQSMIEEWASYAEKKNSNNFGVKNDKSN